MAQPEARAATRERLAQLEAMAAARKRKAQPEAVATAKHRMQFQRIDPNKPRTYMNVRNIFSGQH